MLKIEFDMNMPKNCQDCPLFDEEFYYCHGRLQYEIQEVKDIYKQHSSRPDWCPLIEEKISCTKCILGAPYTICWVTQCSNYKVKKKEEERWETLIKQLEKKYESKGNN